VYKTKRLKEEAMRPENLILEYERQAESLISFIKRDEENENKNFRPMPDVLMKIDRLKLWYHRISEMDKHTKAEALKDAEDWKDATDYIHDIHYYYLKTNADIDDDDIEEVSRAGIKLQELEKRWANKIGESKLEEYWKNEEKAKSAHIWSDLNKG
jgi:hypothetical protein